MQDTMSQNFIRENSTIDQYINVRIQVHLSIRQLNVELKKAIMKMINGLPFYIIRISENGNNQLNKDLENSLATNPLLSTKVPILFRTLSQNGHTYIFFFKKYTNCGFVLPTLHSSDSILNKDAKVAHCILQMQRKNELDSGELEFLETQLNSENFSLQCIASEILTSYRNYRLPSHLNRAILCYKSTENILDNCGVFDEIAFPENAMQAFCLAQKADQYFVPTTGTLNWILNKTSHKFYSTSDFIKAQYCAEAETLDRINSTTHLIVQNIPAHANIFEFLLEIQPKIKPGGYLLFTTELISNFHTEDEQNLNFWKYKIYQIIQILWNKSCFADAENVNGNDLILYQQFQFAVFEAYIHLQKGSLAKAKRILSEIMNLCGIFLQDRLISPTLNLFRIALGKLEFLIQNESSFDTAKTSVENLITLSNEVGFQLIEHNKIFAGPGKNIQDSGTHLFVLKR
jgi:hypothetical protein